MSARCFFVASLLAMAGCSGGGTDGTGSAQSMVFASWGGAYQEAVEQAWVEPFSAETGIDVFRDTEPEVARIRAMVDTGNVEWDVVTGGGETLMRGADLGLFVEITDDMVDQGSVLPEVRNAYGVPSEIFSTVIGFSRSAFPDGGPKTFADFWDVERFPGRRALPDRPATVLEAALLADGVPKEEIYAVLGTDAGFERALNKVRAIREHVAFWWSSGAQPVQALGSGEVVMALGWNGRFQSGIDDGLDIEISWDESVAQAGYFMIPAGAPNLEHAVSFLNYIVRPEVQARLSEHIAYGPITPDSMDYIDAPRAARLPSTPARLEHAVFMDIAWWSERATETSEAYTAMLQE
jgi:putative spermidine/putrescine transport system substrate-binding protein